MTGKSYVLVSGLPHSGARLLCDLLNQNPRFDVNNSRSALGLMIGIRNQWDSWTGPDRDPPSTKTRVLRAVLDAYHSTSDAPLSIDEADGWLAHLEMAEHVIGVPVRVLVPVRDVREVLATFESNWRNDSATAQDDQEHRSYVDFQTLEGRLSVWTSEDQRLGLALNRIKDAIHRGYGNSMHFVRFEQICEDPRTVFDSVYRFLGEPIYPHQFDDVKPTTTIWPQMLGQAANRFAGVNLW